MNSELSESEADVRGFLEWGGGLARPSSLRTVMAEYDRLRAVADAARVVYYVYDPADSHTEHNVRVGMAALGDALAALDSEQS